MKRKINSNSGFTLIELIIALAMLAFIMISVSSFLSSGMLSFRKAKADISVHNSAQDTYNQIVDSAIQANDIVICGYIAENPDKYRNLFDHVANLKRIFETHKDFPYFPLFFKVF